MFFVPHGAWQPWTLYCTEKIHHKFSFCERKQSNKNNTWINNDITCIFGWTIPLSVLLIILYLLCWPDLFSHVLWVILSPTHLLIFSAWVSFQCLMLVPKVKSCVFSTKSSTFEFLLVSGASKSIKDLTVAAARSLFTPWFRAFPSLLGCIKMYYL